MPGPEPRPGGPGRPGGHDDVDERPGRPAAGESAHRLDADPSGPEAAERGEAAAVPRRGPDLARAALAAAKARAQQEGRAQPGGPRTSGRSAAARRAPRSGDSRDPVPFAAAISALVGERGWQEQTAAARVVGEWDRLVGAELAEHCRPAGLVAGELVLVAESSAWATQVRLLARQLVARLAEAVGPGVVERVVVRGPSQPDWRRGPRRVQGRGPRDTYG